MVEKHMETLSKKKSELADMWTSWQLHYSQIKSVKKQWKKFKDQLKKVTVLRKCCFFLVDVKKFKTKKRSKWSIFLKLKNYYIVNWFVM